MMNEQYRIYPLKDWSRIKELQNVFKQGLAETDEGYWNWKYMEPNGLEDRTLLIVENNNSIVGMVGLQPLIYKNNLKVYKMVQMQDLILLPECRGTGLMRKLYFFALDYCKRKGFDGFVQHPNENSYGPLIKYGAKDMGKIGSIKTKNKINFFKSISYKKINEYEIKVSDCLAFDIQSKKNDSYLQLQKNTVFLQWRFDKNPDFQFRYVNIIKNDELCGYFVFHIYKGRINKAVNVYDYDFFQYIPDNVLIQVITLLKSYGNWVSIWGRLSEEHNNKFLNMGFSKEENSNSNFTVHFFNEENKEDWILTRADLDF